MRAREQLAITVTNLVNDALAESRVWFSTLDRSPLGSFAVNAEVLIATQARERLGVNATDIKREAAWEVENALVSAMQAANIDGAGYSVFLPLRAEVMFWWLHCNDDRELVRYVEPQRAANTGAVSMNELITRLETVYSNPTAHPYFEVGIWELELIERFIAEGVDAAMAAELVASP